MHLSHVGHSPRSWSADIPGPISHGWRATPRGHWFSGTSGLPCGGHGGLGSQRRPSGTKEIRPACLEVEGLRRDGWVPVIMPTRAITGFESLTSSLF